MKKDSKETSSASSIIKVGICIAVIAFILLSWNDYQKKAERAAEARYKEIYNEAYKEGYEKGRDDGWFEAADAAYGNDDNDNFSDLWRNIYNAGFDYGFACGYYARENGHRYREDNYPWHSLDSHYQGIYEYCGDTVFDDLHEP